MTCPLPLTTIAILLTLAAPVAAELKVEPDKDNVVASRLEGRWKVNDQYTFPRLSIPRAAN